MSLRARAAAFDLAVGDEHIAKALDVDHGHGRKTMCGAVVIALKRSAALLGLLLVIAFTVGKVDWASAATPHAHLATTTTLAAVLTAAAVVASNPMSFLFNGPDWVRYLPAAMPAR